jgi:hypothetical protein
VHKHDPAANGYFRGTRPSLRTTHADDGGGDRRNARHPALDGVGDPGSARARTAGPARPRACGAVRGVTAGVVASVREEEAGPATELCSPWSSASCALGVPSAVSDFGRGSGCRASNKALYAFRRAEAVNPSSRARTACGSLP